MTSRNSSEEGRYCGGSDCSASAWCGDRWCYVPNAPGCRAFGLQESHFFRGVELFYSYRTCGAVDKFTDTLDPGLAAGVPRVANAYGKPLLLH